MAAMDATSFQGTRDTADPLDEQLAGSLRVVAPVVGAIFLVSAAVGLASGDASPA
jgi:hypothetical protein